MSCRALQPLVALVAILVLGPMIAACGQKGPLYLPETPPAHKHPGQKQGQAIGQTAKDAPANPTPDRPAPLAIPGPEVMPPPIR